MNVTELPIYLFVVSTSVFQSPEPDHTSHWFSSALICEGVDREHLDFQSKCLIVELRILQITQKSS